MKQLLIIFFSFIPVGGFSQNNCNFQVIIRNNPPDLNDIIEWDNEDKMDIIRWPEVKASEITDTFQIYHLCSENGVTIIHAIRPHENVDENGFRNGYQIIFSEERKPVELENLSSGDSIFMKIIPFFKANRMPGSFDRPIQLDGVWMIVRQTESSNIYRIDSSSIYRLTLKPQ